MNCTWTRTDDELPSEGAQVLGFNENRSGWFGLCVCMSREKDSWIWNGQSGGADPSRHRPTHWMHLPPLPE